MDINPLANPKGSKLVCEICQMPAFLQCKACKLTYYCSVEHQKADWVGIHEKICEKLAFLRQPTPFMPSKEEREKRQMQVKLMKIDLIEMSRTLAQKMLFEGKHEESVPAAMQSLRYAIDVFGVATIDLVPSYLLLGEASVGLGKLTQAEDYLAKAQWTVLKTPDSSRAIKSKLYRNLGLLYAAKGDIEESLRNFADDIYHSSEEFGTDHIRTSGGYFHMANVFFRQGKMDVADSMYRQVINIWHEHLSDILTQVVAMETTAKSKSRMIGPAKGLLDEISSGQDAAQDAEAVQILTSIYDIREHQTNRQAQDLAQTCHALAMLYFVLGDIKKAKEFGRKAIVASDQVKDDNFSKSLVEFMKFCEKQSTL
ncbi:zinc finger MYND domain-containing protein 12-like [Physella acuta]|uniref:zinc finger MYND domain-containing protein 12-like n=1 Tax=Physella acuta TaxID=109671 RepID=UPI0027DBE4B8|nr:zinc finger MYND domain-containing protein 12-like [Physella acuta]